MSDLFPGVVLPEPDYVNLLEALRSQCAAQNLQATEYFLDKVIQLYEMVVVRHGLMVVGLSFSGKTKAIQVLAGALSELKDKGLNGEEHVEVRSPLPRSCSIGRVSMGIMGRASYHDTVPGTLCGVSYNTMRLATLLLPAARCCSRLASRGTLCLGRRVTGAAHVDKLGSPGLKRGSPLAQVRILNPKSVTMGQLYGETDKATQEWRDGVLAVQFRQLSSDPSPDRKWLVLDGPVDAIWIENMNTVLDDNKKLCLPNSEIVQMSSTMTMMFEVADLAVASPATVSRCGMVYLEPHQLGWKPLLASWAAVLPDLLKPHAERITSTVEWLLTPLARYLRRSLSEISPTGDANVAVALMRMTHALAANWATAAEGTKATLEAPAVDAMVLFSVIWSVGGTTDARGREHFSAALRALLGGEAPPGVEPMFMAAQPVELQCPPLPAEGSVYDVVLSCAPGKPVAWQQWTDIVTNEQRLIPAGTSFSQIIVPTSDSARYTYLLDLAVQHGYPCVVVGPTGTGKSVYINRYLVNLPKDRFTPICISMSARTTANQTQEQVDGRLDKRRKGVYGPPPGRKAIVFVDDLNMPTLEVPTPASPLPGPCRSWARPLCAAPGRTLRWAGPRSAPGVRQRDAPPVRRRLSRCAPRRCMARSRPSSCCGSSSTTAAGTAGTISSGSWPTCSSWRPWARRAAGATR